MTTASPAMDRLTAALKDVGSRGIPPVERWSPDFCGDIDIRIAADGSWSYLGTPIGRPALVKLFSSVLKREGDDHYLVTPVEKLRITVDDAPFAAVEMQVEGEGASRSIAFRTQVDEVVGLGDGHELRFEREAGGGLKPYIHIRRDLWALVTRAVTYDLLALGDIRDVDGEAMFGIAAGERFYPAVPARELEESP